MPIYIQVVILISSNMQGTIFVSSFIKINHMDQPERTEVDSHLWLSQTGLPRHSSMCEPWGASPGLPESGKVLTLGRGPHAAALATEAARSWEGGRTFPHFLLLSSPFLVGSAGPSLTLLTGPTGLCLLGSCLEGSERMNGCLESNSCSGERLRYAEVRLSHRRDK